MEENQDKMFVNILKNAGNYERKNAMSSVCWVLSVLLPMSVSIFIWGALWVQIFFAILDLLCVFWYFYTYNHFMKHDPDRLQSEKFQIAKYAKQLAAQKGNSAIEIQNQDGVKLNQYEQKKLENGKEDE